MNIVIWLLVILVKLFLIQSIVIASENHNSLHDVNKKQNQTIHEPNSVRFQRILKRKKRFLLFPPGSALVVIII